MTAILALNILEVVSKPRIRPESKAQPDEKAQHTRKYVSILKRAATQLSGLRWGFETASMKYSPFRPKIAKIKNNPHTV